MQNTTENKITIEAELAIPLGELATYLFENEKNDALILAMIDNHPNTVKSEVEKICKERINGIYGLRVEKIEFDYVDSKSLDFGVAYFKAKLTGTKKALKKVAGNEDKLFQFDWNHYQKTKLKA